VTFKGKEDTATVQIPIIDDEAWNPDLEFSVILYDVNTLGQTTKGENDRLSGGDTLCKVTILDEDFPGTIEFAKTEMEVSRKSKFVDIEVQRIDGSDGTIHCEIKTEEMKDSGSAAAQPFEHFMPM
jgi:hypothetical protein